MKHLSSKDKRQRCFIKYCWWNSCKRAAAQLGWCLLKTKLVFSFFFKKKEALRSHSFPMLKFPLSSRMCGMNVNELFRLSYEVIHGASLSIGVLSGSWMSWALYPMPHPVIPVTRVSGGQGTFSPCSLHPAYSQLRFCSNLGEWGCNSRTSTFIVLDKRLLKKVQVHRPSTPPPPGLPISSPQRQPSKQEVPLDHTNPRRKINQSAIGEMNQQTSQRHRTCLIRIHISWAVPRSHRYPINTGCTELELLFPLPTSSPESVTPLWVSYEATTKIFYL